jgi:hypothetical protein
MNRRELIGLIGGAAAWPIAVHAQAMPVVAFINGGSLDANAGNVAAFRKVSTKPATSKAKT